MAVDTDLLIRISADISSAQAKLRQLQQEMRSTSSSVTNETKTMSTAMEGLNAALGFAARFVSFAAIIAGLHELAEASISAERNMSQLKRSVDLVGASGGGWAAYGARVEEATAKTATFAHVTQGEVLAVFRELYGATKDMEGSMKNLPLVFDVAEGSGRGLETATRAVSSAMLGQTYGLRGLGPEWRGLTSEMNENTSTSEKSAIMMAKMTERYEGSVAIMPKAAAAQKDFKTAVKDSVEWLGDFIFKMDEVDSKQARMKKGMEEWAAGLLGIKKIGVVTREWQGPLQPEQQGAAEAVRQDALLKRQKDRVLDLAKATSSLGAGVAGNELRQFGESVNAAFTRLNWAAGQTPDYEAMFTTIERGANDVERAMDRQAAVQKKALDDLRPLLRGAGVSEVEYASVTTKASLERNAAYQGEVKQRQAALKQMADLAKGEYESAKKQLDEFKGMATAEKFGKASQFEQKGIVSEQYVSAVNMKSGQAQVDALKKASEMAGQISGGGGASLKKDIDEQIIASLTDMQDKAERATKAGQEGFEAMVIAEKEALVEAGKLGTALATEAFQVKIHGLPEEIELVKILNKNFEETKKLLEDINGPAGWGGAKLIKPGEGEEAAKGLKPWGVGEMKPWTTGGQSLGEKGGSTVIINITGPNITDSATVRDIVSRQVLPAIEKLQTAQGKEYDYSGMGAG